MSQQQSQDPFKGSIQELAMSNIQRTESEIDTVTMKHAKPEDFRNVEIPEVLRPLELKK